ncbi:cytochrome b/b6 domain-containing protein [Thiovibrio frasassiensis]|uniref:Cytochrome b/b6 domain-containing protein n=1 Tax=Thiovibrio frasassiensis TaxID=2984131 RepID=A0A9X4MLH7_9BACT|nr:cytochrome b/b6 domain-containing protein [Thiovibrio frasassiensis]MDG4474977.1 cytochrome b/b6 domain-containing protein [Thiovibrio frasassiensis]
MKNTEKVYVHPAPIRVWHWINAAGFIVLVATGFQIRFAEVFSFLSLRDAIVLHNYTGFLVMADYLLWLGYYLGTGKITIYFPKLQDFIPKTIAQARYYGCGLFRGEKNPHQMTPENKFNPLQQQAYVGLMFFLVPVQIFSGLFLWQVKKHEAYLGLLGGIKVVDTLHVLLFFFFAVFLIVHFYLATLGHTPFAHFKAMFTGYEEHHH